MLLTASCHCEATHYSFTVAESLLPLEAYLCSCHISRRISGVLLTAYVPIPGHNPPPSVDHLSTYNSSSILKRHFCSTCGTHMFLEYNDDGHFEVSTGTIDQSDGVVSYQGFMWIESTRDGGASILWPKLGERRAERWAQEQGSQEVPFDWRSITSASGPQTKPTDQRLHVHCHCRGVEFFITRPDESSFQAKSYYPDILVPYNSGQSAANPDNHPWWLSVDHKRYLAGMCTCESCRMISGFDLVQWAFIPITNIVLPNGKPYSRDVQLGTTKQYSSSPNVVRHFCSVCGANVFWDGSKRPTLLDVAVGLLDAESGARAEEWLEWAHDRVSFSEDSHNQEFVPR